MDSIENIGLPHPVVADKAVDFRSEPVVSLAEILEINKRNRNQMHLELEL